MKTVSPFSSGTFFSQGLLLASPLMQRERPYNRPCTVAGLVLEIALPAVHFGLYSRLMRLLYLLFAGPCQ